MIGFHLPNSAEVKQVIHYLPKTNPITILILLKISDHSRVQIGRANLCKVAFINISLFEKQFVGLFAPYKG